MAGRLADAATWAQSRAGARLSLGGETVPQQLPFLSEVFLSYPVAMREGKPNVRVSGSRYALHEVSLT